MRLPVLYPSACSLATKYGLSKASYRVVWLSGSSRAIFPAAAPPPPLLEVVLVPLLPPQAASTRPAIAAATRGPASARRRRPPRRVDIPFMPCLPHDLWPLGRAREPASREILAGRTPCRASPVRMISSV